MKYFKGKSKEQILDILEANNADDRLIHLLKNNDDVYSLFASLLSYTNDPDGIDTRDIEKIKFINTLFLKLTDRNERQILLNFIEKIPDYFD